MKVPAYPRTKSSGVEWLGDVPEHWEVKRISLLASREARSFTDGDWIESPYITDEGVRLLQTGNVGIGEYREQGYRYVTEQTFRELRCTEVRPKDVLICRLAAPVGRACLAPDLGCKMITSVDVCILSPAPEVNSRFVVYFFSSKNYLDWLDALCRGSTRDRISRSMLGALRSLLPPLAEQRAIAAFLDRETALVDRLVAKKRELIERLKEKCTALISHTVTRGLPPAAARIAGFAANPPLKPSGVEWIGETPRHWAVMKVKFVAKMESGHTPSKSEPLNWVEDECVIPWVSLNDTKFLKENDFIGDTAVKISGEGMSNSSAHLLPAGVVVFTRDATIGLTAITTCPAAVSQHIIAWVPGSNITPKYLLLSFKAMQQYLESFTFGSTLKTIGMTDVRKLVTPVPPLPEQAAIAAYLDKETAKLDALVGKVEEAVERLQEYRTALITAAVTGKIDLRNSDG